MNSRRHLNIMKHLEILKPKLPSRWTSHHLVLSKKMKTTCLERSVVLCHSHSSAFFLDNMATHREVYYVLSWLISFLFLTLKFYWVTFVFFLENVTPLYWDRYCLLLLSFSLQNYGVISIIFFTLLNGLLRLKALFEENCFHCCLVQSWRLGNWLGLFFLVVSILKAVETPSRVGGNELSGFSDTPGNEASTSMPPSHAIKGYSPVADGGDPFLLMMGVLKDDVVGIDGLVCFFQRIQVWYYK